MVATKLQNRPQRRRRRAQSRRRRKLLHHPLRLERLESRQLLAGDGFTVPLAADDVADGDDGLDAFNLQHTIVEHGVLRNGERAELSNSGQSSGVGQVWGRVWEDRDGDGQWVTGELGLDGTEVQLLDDQGRLVASHLSRSIDLDANGAIDPETESGVYQFTDVPPGTYTVREVVPSGWHRSFSVADPESLAAGAKSHWVTVADLNNDGNLDLAVANGRSSDVSVLLNNGDGTFARRRRLAAGSVPWAATASDLDGDGDLDLAIASAYSDEASVLMNHGNGTFAPAISYPVGDYPIRVAAADLDGDGDQDLALANYLSHNVSVLRNTGDGTFDAAEHFASDNRPRALLAEDFDEDGDLDLAVGNQAAGTVTLLRNGGGCQFGEPERYSVGTYGSVISLDAGDLDGDGDLDLAVANPQENEIWLFGNAGDGTFELVRRIAADGHPNSVHTVDMDGDGDLDLALANRGSDTATVLQNTGPWQFRLAVEMSAGAAPECIATGDLDGDGDLDLVTANSDEEFDTHNVSLLWNEAGTYQVNVGGGEAIRAGDFGNYKMGDYAEPNDSPESAYDLGAANGVVELVGLNVHQANNDDWYRFTLPEAGRSDDRVSIQFSHEAGDLDLYLYSSDTQPTAAGMASASTVREYPLRSLRDGQEIYGAQKPGSSERTGAYSRTRQRLAVRPTTSAGGNARRPRSSIRTWLEFSLTLWYPMIPRFIGRLPAKGWTVWSNWKSKGPTWAAMRFAPVR